jgi:acetyl-CoA carboxylase carboxyltransferase component
VNWQPEIDEIARRRELAERMGGPEKVARQHAAGRSTVRERITALADPGTFDEIGALAGTASYVDGSLDSFVPANFVLGTARLDGRRVALGGDDFTVRGGAADAAIMEKQIYAERLANELGLPLVRLIEGTGGGGSDKMLEQYGFTYVPVNPGWDLVVDNLSAVPVVSLCLGPVAGLGAARAVMSHLCVLVEGTGQLFVAGPPVVKHATGEDLTKEELGGAEVHRRSGAVDRIVASEAEAFAVTKQFLGYLPSSVDSLPPVVSTPDPTDRRDEALVSLVPRNRRHPYRLRPLLEGVFDSDSVFDYAVSGGSAYAGLARLAGHPVGVLATDPVPRSNADPRRRRRADAPGRFVRDVPPAVGVIDGPGGHADRSGSRASGRNPPRSPRGDGGVPGPGPDGGGDHPAGVRSGRSGPGESPPPGPPLGLALRRLGIAPGRGRHRGCI